MSNTDYRPNNLELVEDVRHPSTDRLVLGKLADLSMECFTKMIKNNKEEKR